MSKRAVQLLKAIGLLDSQGAVADVDRMPEQELRDILAYYVRSRREGADTEVTSLANQPLPLQAFLSSVSASNAVIPILPSLLLFGRVYAEDPVFKFAFPATQHKKSHQQAFGGDPNAPIDRVMLVNKLTYFSMLQGFIEDGILAALPIHLLHAPPDALPMYYSEDRFRSNVPTGVYDYVHSHALIRDAILDRSTGHLIIPQRPKQDPSRSIAVAFKNDNVNAGMVYFYQEMRYEGETPDGKLMKVSFEVDFDKPISKAAYDAWVEQSVNRTVLNRLSAVGAETHVASRLQATYLTESAFESRLLSLAGGIVSPAGSSDRAVNFLRTNADCLRLDDPNVVLRLRRQSPSVFAAFRQALMDAASELQGCDPENFPTEAQRVLRRCIRSHSDAVRQCVRNAIAGSVGGALVATNSISLALLSGVSLPLGAIAAVIASGAAGTALPSISEYLDRRKQPEHILWKLQTKK